MNSEFQNTKIYTDFQGFSSLKQKARENDPKAVEAAAKQFEALFIQSMLKSMRSANQMFGSDGFLKSDSVDFYQGMFDQQIAISLSENKGLGLAKVLAEQLQRYQNGAQANKSEAEKNSNQLINSIKYKLPETSQHALKEVMMKDQSIIPEPNLEKLLTQISELATKLSFNSPLDFVKSLMPSAKLVAEKLGLDPKMLLAQAALETGWGKAIITDKSGKSSHNLFNIKADKSWGKANVSVKTDEFINNEKQEVQALFRQYESVKESFEDYFNFLSNNQRYAKALSVTHNPKEFIQELQKAGYATDPNYADKIWRIYQGETLNESIKQVSELP